MIALIEFVLFVWISWKIIKRIGCLGYWMLALFLCIAIEIVSCAVEIAF